MKDIDLLILMHNSIKKLIKLYNTLKKYNHDNFKSPYSTMDFGYIQGEGIVNRICSHCKLHIDIGPIANIYINKINILLEKQ
ncbi:peptidase dimerization domain-containing protein [Pantoea sp. Mhis]|uniref:peptidase dimerization domain-containing protein n=1 Tax=Pantoea sp. Mhis TaxID=2576759 RepID=UPI001358F8C0|nr:peptidase dimerization domain-containing protein [Pantoea sp. Mhis]MXP56636.1 hypothetical protein [Pantoea sp. Mhis]